MRIFKIIFSVLVVGFVFIAVGCSASATAERRLEQNGYRVESGDEEDVSNELSQWGIENVNNISLVYEGDSDDDVPNAIIIEYSSRTELEADILGDDETIEDYEDNVYENLFVISLEIANIDHIIDIIKAE